MNKKTVFIILGLVLLSVGLFLLLRLIFSSGGGQASLKITSTPASTIFLDDEQLGKTPYEDKVKSNEYTLKLIPEGAILPTWQTKIKINPNVLTYVNHDFADQELTSAGEILTLEKISGQKAEISVISVPDSALVMLDGVAYGSTPVMLSDIPAGEHEINVSASGFAARGIKVKTTPGFKLIASFQLALSAAPEASPTPAPSASPTASPKATPKTSPKPSASASAQLQKPYVEILDTPTGFLRVRMEPSTSATEAAQVKPGETFPLLSEQSGWYKIKYEGTKEGWISGQYAEKFE